jgi:hypothetical protein
MLIPSIVGTNSLGTMGPSTTSWILELDLEEVSTIADGSITQQLTLSHLGTDCPQSADASAIATMSDSRCAPILAAPDQVTSWAYPCNACGEFGLFDPPYAVPTVTGGILGTVTVTPPSEVTEEPTPTSEVVSSVESTVVDEPVPTSEVVSSVESTVVDEPAPTSEIVSSATSDAVDTQVTSTDISANVPTTGVTTTADLPSTTLPGLATKVMGGSYWYILTTFTVIFLY